MANIIKKWDEDPHRPLAGRPIDPHLQAEAAQAQFGDGLLLLAGTVSCKRHGMERVGEGINPLTGLNKPNKYVAQTCFACTHVFKAASVEFSGLKEIRCLYLMPGIIYLCETCKRHVEERKFQFETTCCACCWSCVQDMATWIKKQDPSRFVDFSMATNVKLDPMKQNKIV